MSFKNALIVGGITLVALAIAWRIPTVRGLVVPGAT